MSPDPGEPAGGAFPRVPRDSRGPPVGSPDHRGEQAPIRTDLEIALSAWSRLSRERSGRDRLGRRFAPHVDGVFDAARDGVYRLRVLADRVEGAVLAPAGDVGDRLAADVEADGAEHAVGDAVDEDLAALSAEFRVPEAVPVRDLMGQGADLPVRGAGGDGDLLALGVAPSGRAVAGQVRELDRVAELGGVGDQRGDQ